MTEINSFIIISSLVLYGLTILCFVLPYKSGQKITAFSVSSILGILITIGIIGNLDFLVVFIWLAVLLFQIVFLSYWGFRFYGKKKAGTIISLIIFGIFFLAIMQPWISDWTFNKRDARKIMSYHNFELKDDFEIIRNESGGLRDYYHSFTLKVSHSDYQNIAKEIRNSENYQGLITDLTKQLPRANYKTKDTVNFETNYHIEREYYSEQKMNDGTFHFHFQLSKSKNEFSYIGSDE